MGLKYPRRTAVVFIFGYPRAGTLVKVEDDGALYLFTGDFIAGDSFEIWLHSPEEARSAKLLRQALQAAGVQGISGGQRRGPAR